MNRRQFVSAALGATAAGAGLSAAPGARRPNVIILITDDQGYGDLSLHGNPYLGTPSLDRIGAEGVQFTQFQVCPVCSPTRSSLMTGRYNYRTGIVDTYQGRSMMYPDEVTLAEVLANNGYRTGIFGKWHLGDNYPMRPIDQGFQEALVHKGGGMMQASDPPGSGYFDPVLQHNGKQEKFRGYCTDVFFNAALEWIETNRQGPFFAYIATNAPHVPLLIADEWVEPFRKQRLEDATAKVYGMVANIDHNAGRLLAALKKLNLERDTIILYLTDNGPQHDRYNAGMRGRKGTVYQGGIRVPCFLRWPGGLPAGRKVDRIAAHIDILPTILQACGVRKPDGVKLDGVSLWPLAAGSPARWPDRMLFTQWHRGDEPELFRACAVRTQQYKLIDGKELYDLAADPGEQQDLSARQPEVLARLRAAYEEWFRDVSSTRGYAPPRIHLGSKHENPVTLTRQDWRLPPNVRGPAAVGWWEVEVTRSGNYEITVTVEPADADGEVHFQLSGVERKQPLAHGAAECRFPPVALQSGPGRLTAFLKAGERSRGARFVDVRFGSQS